MPTPVELAIVPPEPLSAEPPSPVIGEAAVDAGAVEHDAARRAVRARAFERQPRAADIGHRDAERGAGGRGDRVAAPVAVTVTRRRSLEAAPLVLTMSSLAEREAPAVPDEVDAGRRPGRDRPAAREGDGGRGAGDVDAAASVRAGDRRRAGYGEAAAHPGEVDRAAARAGRAGAVQRDVEPPPWSMSTAARRPRADVGDRQRAGAAPLSAMSAPLVSPTSRPEIVLFWATFTPSPPVVAIVGPRASAPAGSIWSSRRVEPSASA